MLTRPEHSGNQIQMERAKSALCSLPVVPGGVSDVPVIRQTVITTSSASRGLGRPPAPPISKLDPGVRSLYQRPLKATRVGALFGAFPYPTKISPESIAIFIAAHTKPGETVLDVFAGSGTAGLAAMLCERPTDEMRSEAEKLGLKPTWGPRNAVLYELSALGAFIGHTLTHPPAPLAFQKAAEAVLSDAEDELRHLYAAEAPDGGPGVIRYIIWSDVLRCPSCRKRATLWDGCVSRRPASISTTFKCPHCRKSAPLDSVERVTSQQSDPVLGGKRKLRLREPVWVYGSSGRKNWSRAANEGDVLTAKLALMEPIPASVPDVAIPWGDLYRSGYHTGITHLHHFYTTRNLVVFGRLWDRTFAYDGPLGDALRFWLLSYNASHSTIMTRVVAKAGQDDLVVTSGQPGVLYVSGLPVEKNLFSGLRRKLKTIAEAFSITHGSKANVRVVQASSAKLDLAAASVDYVFTDPPFGGNIPYAEVNFINEAWLGRFTDRKGEAIVSPAQGKSLDDYQHLLTASLSEARRVLKDNGQATLVFHSATASVWNALQAAYTDAGFSVRYAGILDKTQGSFKQVTTSGAVKGDPVLFLERMPANSNEQSLDVWAVADQLRLAASSSNDPNERTPERLYSRLVAHYLTRKQRVPLNAEAFYRWHEEQCPKEIGSMQSTQGREVIRAEARRFEQSLPQDRRKQLGQFFTGVPLGKVLAHLAIREDTRTVLDPMAGHGDLLDAVAEAAAETGTRLYRLDGIEVDPETARLAQRRLRDLNTDGQPPVSQVVEGDAFAPSSLTALGCKAYDLVIANPPYVRYQSRKCRTAKDAVRAGLHAVVEGMPSESSAAVWRELARGYSGLADLSVPAWLLAAALVKPGGRLALVVPATWRSRDYADVVRYLLLRCFEVEAIVEDQQPGWFSDALVRTHLIVAKRLDEAHVAVPVSARNNLKSAIWLEIEPKAATQSSLVGAAIPGEHPELELARWLRAGKRGKRTGLAVRSFDFRKEWAELQEHARTKAWMKTLESFGVASAARTAAGASDAVPSAIHKLIPKQNRALQFITLQQLGIESGQGLRTGCNAFFYVTAIERRPKGKILVETADLFGPRRMLLPEAILKLVLRRQSELKAYAQGTPLDGRVLVLTGWALPEDLNGGRKRSRSSDLFGETQFRIVPDDLADFIRLAARTRLKGASDGPVIPELSAVRTNVRIAKDGACERFWYMLPDFAPRHQPAAFVPRIIQDTPWVEANASEPFLVDANFSTFWSASVGWSGAAIKALLNSSWCRAYMEVTGTPMGGGALKLEAAHIRRILLPPLPKDAAPRLHKVGKCLNGSLNANIQAVNEVVLGAICGDSPRAIQRLGSALEELAEALSAVRQRGRP